MTYAFRNKNQSISAIVILVGLLILIVVVWSMLLASTQRGSLDQRTQAVAQQIKCPICQGESIADSSTTIAQQMREIVRAQLQSGKSEQEVLQYFRTRYGDQIVLTPSWSGLSLLAWLMPFVLVLGGIVLLWRLSQTQKQPGNVVGDEKPAPVLHDDSALAAYREQLERELAAEDVLFTQNPAGVTGEAHQPYRTEASS